jgi:hypothetical protein
VKSQFSEQTHIKCWRLGLQLMEFWEVVENLGGGA